MTRPPSLSTLFPYTTLFRSIRRLDGLDVTGFLLAGTFEKTRGFRESVRQQQIERVLRIGGTERTPVVKLHPIARSEEHTSELQSRLHLVCRLLLEKKKDQKVRRRGRLRARNKSRRHCESPKQQT